MTHEDLFEKMQECQGHNIIIDCGGKSYATYILTCMDCKRNIFAISKDSLLAKLTSGSQFD